MIQYNVLVYYTVLYYIIRFIHSAPSVAPKARSEDGRVPAAVDLSAVHSTTPVLEYYIITYYIMSYNIIEYHIIQCNII